MSYLCYPIVCCPNVLTPFPGMFGQHTIWGYKREDHDKAWQQSGGIHRGWHFAGYICHDPCVFGTPIRGDPGHLCLQKTSLCGTMWHCLRDDIFSLVDRTLTCEGRTYTSVFCSSTTTKTKIFVDENKLIFVTKTTTKTKMRQFSLTKRKLKLKLNLLTKTTTKIWLFSSTRRKFQSGVLALTSE